MSAIFEKAQTYKAAVGVLTFEEKRLRDFEGALEQARKNVEAAKLCVEVASEGERMAWAALAEEHRRREPKCPRGCGSKAAPGPWHLSDCDLFDRTVEP